MRDIEEYTSKEKDKGGAEYGKDRCPRSQISEKEYGKVRIAPETKSVSNVPVKSAAQKPRENRNAVPSVQHTAAFEKPQEKKNHLSVPLMLGIAASVAVIALSVLSLCFWSFGQWFFGAVLGVGLVVVAIWFYVNSEYYIPQMWIAGIFSVLNVILVFLLKDNYYMMAILIALGLAAIFFLCTYYAYDDVEEERGVFSSVLMACDLFVATGVIGGFSLLWLFACFLPGVLIVAIVACALLDLDDVYLFGHWVNAGIVLASIVAAVTLLVHLLFELICSFFCVK